MAATVMTPAIEVLPCVDCDALHCMNEHPNLEDPEQRDDALRHAVSTLAEAYHRTHDVHFAWRLCADEVCRETAHALGVR